MIDESEILAGGMCLEQNCSSLAVMAANVLKHQWNAAMNAGLIASIESTGASKQNRP